MIKKISRIDNFAVFEKYNWDQSTLDSNGLPLSFEKINILYGRNYSGKTTLSRMIRSLETHQLPEKYDNPHFELVFDDDTKITENMISESSLNIRVFNEDFVRTNLRFLLDPESEIVPFAILGANNLEIEKIIKDFEAEIGSNVDSQETGLYKQFKDAKQSATKLSTNYDNAKKKLDSKLSKKALNRQSGIKYNADRFGDQNYTTIKINQEIKIVLAQTYQNLGTEKKIEYENRIREQQKPQISSLIIPNLKLKSFCEKASALLSHEIGSSNKIAELLLDTILNDWVKQGTSLHQTRGDCAFCGNPISKDRWEKIHIHFDEESKTLENKIDSLIFHINSEKEMLHSLYEVNKTAFYNVYCSKIDDFIDSSTKLTHEYYSSLDKIIEQLKMRKAHITVPIQLESISDNSEELSILIVDFNKIIIQNNEYSNLLTSSKTSAQKALRLQEVADFCSMIDYVSEIQYISTLKKCSDDGSAHLSKIEILLNSKIQELHKKLRQLNDEEEGARRVNTYLNDYFGHKFITLEA